MTGSTAVPGPQEGRVKSGIPAFRTLKQEELRLASANMMSSRLAWATEWDLVRRGFFVLFRFRMKFSGQRIPFVIVFFTHRLNVTS